MSHSGEGNSGFLDTVAKVVREKAAKPKESGGFMEMILAKFGFGEKVRAIQEDAKESRSRLFVDIVDSVIGKKFPMISSIIDGTVRPFVDSKLESAGISADKSTLPWAKEIQKYLAWAQILDKIPFINTYYRKVTEKLQHSPTFQAIVEHWPGVTAEMKADIKSSESKPAAVLNFFRMVLKDAEAASTTMSQVLSIIPGIGTNERVANDTNQTAEAA